MVGKACILLVALCALAAAQNIRESRVLTYDEIVESTWKFSNDNGYLGFMRF